MKFRELKKREFVIFLTLTECYYANKDGKLTEYIKWEYDNGLYINSGINEAPGKWKELKEYLKESKGSKYNKAQIWINNGKCHRCGKKLTKSNFKFDFDYIERCFENDYFYCDECKQKQVEYFETHILELEDEEEIED